jgi:hypothetical protein
MSEAATLGRTEWRASAAPFTATAFIGASLIFLVQPMFARMATPLLGGAPAVWNVSLVCFQAALLLGYAYAHLLQRISTVRTQVLVHAIVLVLGFLCLPLRISGIMGPPPAEGVQVWLLATFAVSIAPPFAALAATAPLIQAWYARSGFNDAADPYHLYAASNIGSLIGLAAYPLLIEPFSALADQSTGWMFGYVVLAIVLLYSGWSITRGRVETPIAMAEGKASAAPSWRERAMWLALSFVPVEPARRRHQPYHHRRRRSALPVGAAADDLPAHLRARLREEADDPARIHSGRRPARRRLRAAYGFQRRAEQHRPHAWG